MKRQRDAVDVDRETVERMGQPMTAERWLDINGWAYQMFSVGMPFNALLECIAEIRRLRPELPQFTPEKQ